MAIALIFFTKASPNYLWTRKIATATLLVGFPLGVVAWVYVEVMSKFSIQYLYACGIFIAGQTGLSESVVGGLFTAVSTSLPELVTTVAAVRHGALTLGVGGVIGGNCFDLLLLAFSDLAYRQGSIYTAIANRQIFVMALTMLMTGILLLGLLEREKHGIGNIGFESVLILLIYAGGIAMLFR